MATKPQIVIINKIDAIQNSDALSKELQALIGREVLAISGVSGYGLERLEGRLLTLVPERTG